MLLLLFAVVRCQCIRNCSLLVHALSLLDWLTEIILIKIILLDQRIRLVCPWTVSDVVSPVKRSLVLLEEKLYRIFLVQIFKDIVHDLPIFFFFKLLFRLFLPPLPVQMHLFVQIGDYHMALNFWNVYLLLLRAILPLQKSIIVVIQ